MTFHTEDKVLTKKFDIPLKMFNLGYNFKIV